MFTWVIVKKSTVWGLFSLMAFHAAFAAAEEVTVKVGADAARTELSACLPRSTTLSCVPAINVSDVHFLFSFEGTLYINLTYDKAAVVDESNMRGIPGMLDFGYGFGRKLTAEQQAWVLTKCNESLRDSFACYQPEDGKSMVALMKTIAGYAEGGNGDVGFIGVLDAPATRPVPDAKSPFGWEIVGMAFPAQRAPAVQSAPVLQPDTKRIESIQTALRAQLADETCRVLQAVESPADHALLAVAEHDRQQSVGTAAVDGKNKEDSQHQRGTSIFYLAPTPSGPRVVPFRGIQYAIEIAPEKGFPLDIYPGSRDKTRVHLLPDMDGNGLDEILIACNEGFLFCPPVPDKGSDGLIGMNPSKQFFYGMRE